jgi:circadian clock protein KaiB
MRVAEPIALNPESRRTTRASSAWTVAGQTSKSVAASSNLKRICETHLKGQYEIEVVDLLVTPGLAKGDQIFAVPSLVRQLPPPVKKIIGDMASESRVLIWLDLQPTYK